MRPSPLVPARAAILTLPPLLAALAILALPAWVAGVEAAPPAQPEPARASRLRLDPLFQDHAVLQRGIPIPVWGTAEPERMVVVRLAGQVARVSAAADGSWLVRLPALPAGGPHELVVDDDRDRVRAGDLLVGEVWFAAGQSNMAWTLAQTPQQLPAEACDLPRIRLLTLDTPARVGRHAEVAARWTPADAGSLAGFSAVAGWFGRALHRELDVPVGLIAGAWGGARIQAWISREGLVRERFAVGDVRAYEASVHLPDEVPRSAWERDMQALDTGDAGLAAGWAAPGFDDAAWETMPVPSRWQEHGHAGSGVFWFRRALEVPAAWRGHELELSLGAADKHDDTWVNGERVGGLSWADGLDTWKTPRVYRVPARLVGADGRLAIAVRVRSHLYHGGLIGPAEAMALRRVDGEGAPLPLSGDWRCRREQDWGTIDPAKATTRLGAGNPQSPYILFDSRVAAVVPYAIRGVIWYQGEANTHEAAVYRELMPALIRDWRRAWGQGDFPFLQVQLANLGQPKETPGQSAWAELRDAQLATLAEPGTGMAVAIDVGDAGDIHPGDKRTVGERLARWALAETYGRGGVPSGPLYAGMTIEAEGRVRCRFRHAGGLRTRDGAAPSRVAIAGADRVFVRAEASIEGETLVAWSPAVPQPVSVRYAWADNPAGCNLVNQDDLPASPFRTDAW